MSSMIHDVVRGAPKSKPNKRKGRGESSGHGKTSGRGNKGSKARNGKYIKRGYEGGQTPIFKRLPKRGFSNQNFERRFHIVNLLDLNQFADGSIVDARVLHEAGLVPDLKQPVKILSEGTLTKKLTVLAGRFSKTAYEKLGAAGGTAQNTKGEAYVFPKIKKKFIVRDPVKKVAKGAVDAEGDAKATAPATAPTAETPKAD